MIMVFLIMILFFIYMVAPIFITFWILEKLKIEYDAIFVGYTVVFFEIAGLLQILYNWRYG